MEMYRQASCLPLGSLSKQFTDARANTIRGQESLFQVWRALIPSTAANEGPVTAR